MFSLQTNGKYHEDIFGITLRTKETTDRARLSILNVFVKIRFNMICIYPMGRNNDFKASKALPP